MRKLRNKYYRWRRNRLREVARNRRKITTHKHPYLQMHMTAKELKKYNDFGYKQYYSSGFTFGTDITGLNLSKADLDEISNLPGEKEYRAKTPKSVVANPIVVTFEEYLNDDGEPVSIPVYNGVPNVHPIYGQQSDVWQGWIERNGKPNV